MSIFTGHCVMLPIPEPLLSPARKAWLDSIFEWLKNIQGDYDLLMVRRGAVLTKEDVLAHNMTGNTISEHIIWFFADPQDARLFKLKWTDE